ncbi:MAG: alkaline phytoceramidase [Bacteroidetes bacterium]|nr:alkaline phytoceramidase [Bacteroidota bacterium]
MNYKHCLLAALTVVSVVVVFLLPPMAQPVVFHRFAGAGEFLGVPNGANVFSNILLLAVGIAGLVAVVRGAGGRGFALLYGVLFLGVALTGVGSAWYHWSPDNDRLVWDRMPMTIVFMALFSVVVAEFVSLRIGMAVLVPLLVVGVGSVWLWHFTEEWGFGDLRLYYWVQFYPMVMIPVIPGLYGERDGRVRALVWVVIWYGAAKVLEWQDWEVYRGIGLSGHTLKHLAAGVSAGYFVVLYRRRGELQKTC